MPAPLPPRAAGRGWAWALWEVTVPVPKGHKGPLELMCKATDESYNTQVGWTSCGCSHPCGWIDELLCKASGQRCACSRFQCLFAGGGVGCGSSCVRCAWPLHCPARNATALSPACRAAGGGGPHLEPARRQLQLVAPRDSERGVKGHGCIKVLST